MGEWVETDAEGSVCYYGLLDLLESPVQRWSSLMQLEGLLAIVELEGSFVLKKVAVGKGCMES